MSKKNPVTVVPMRITEMDPLEKILVCLTASQTTGLLLILHRLENMALRQRKRCAKNSEAYARHSEEILLIQTLTLAIISGADRIAQIKRELDEKLGIGPQGPQDPRRRH